MALEVARPAFVATSVKVLALLHGTKRNVLPEGATDAPSSVTCVAPLVVHESVVPSLPRGFQVPDDGLAVNDRICGENVGGAFGGVPVLGLVVGGPEGPAQARPARWSLAPRCWTGARHGGSQFAFRAGRLSRSRRRL